MTTKLGFCHDIFFFFFVIDVIVFVIVVVVFVVAIYLAIWGYKRVIFINSHVYDNFFGQNTQGESNRQVADISNSKINWNMEELPVLKLK